MRWFLFVMGMLYVLSPIDLYAGIMDDIGCVIIMVTAYCNHRKGLRRKEEEEERRQAERKRKEEEREAQRKKQEQEERRTREEQKEREKREAEIRELECIERMTARKATPEAQHTGFCERCGGAVSMNAAYCSHCGNQIGKKPAETVELPRFCESCGGLLEPMESDESVLVCGHCGYKHLLPGYTQIQVEKIRQETQKESEHHQTQLLTAFLENRNRGKTVEIIVSRAGTIIGVTFCILSLTVKGFGLLLLVGIPLLIYDVVKSKSQRK